MNNPIVSEEMPLHFARGGVDRDAAEGAIQLSPTEIHWYEWARIEDEQGNVEMMYINLPTFVNQVW